MVRSTAWVCLVLAGCGRSDGIDFPQTLSLLEPLAVPELGADEQLAFVSGKTDGRYWAHARAVVDGTIDEVYDALGDPDVLVDRRQIDTWEVSHDTVPRFDRSLTLHQTVHDVVTVHYDTTWVFEVQAVGLRGTERFAAQWDKTDGTPFIDLLAGSMVVQEDAMGRTELQLVTWMEATLRDEATLVSYLTDLHTDVVAAVGDEPLPAY
jgi:hypothetical protein